MSTKIFIGNLSEDVTADDIRELFEKHGKVDEADVLKNYGFVHMPKKSEAVAAIEALNGHSIRGQKMRVELSTGVRGKPKGDRRGYDRERPYPPGPPRRGPPPPDRYDPYDPYYRYPYPERDPYYRLPPLERRLPPLDRYLPRLPPLDDRYPPLRRERLYPEERGYLPPDPRDRYLPRERLPYPDDLYDRLRSTERVPPPADPYYRERSPVSRPPPEYYDRKAALMRTPAESANPPPPPSRMNTTAYPPSNGYDYYRRPAAEALESRMSYNGPGVSQDYKNGPASRAQSAYERPTAPPGQQQLPPRSAGGYGMPPQHQQHQQQPMGQQKRYDSQSALQTKPIFF